MTSPSSAIPPFYYVLFGIYEPILTVSGFLGALLDPKKVRLVICMQSEIIPLIYSADARQPSTVADWPTAFGALTASELGYSRTTSPRMRTRRRSELIRSGCR